ncbi:unnamed protein product (mitochondrion) [Plasmodiophora brassicae]|uniref:DDE-1 domain-containing protein n=1 Tax=Plasmodiophora brassicae TaxID=37360 RepID=A0A3P3YN80_PLABS|nr:unnamed protein product [Plasmodiophora brassicae]
MGKDNEGVARRRCLHTVKQKRAIVRSATARGNIKATAREYDIKPCQIRDWRKNLMGPTDETSSDNNDDEGIIRFEPFSTRTSKRRTRSHGRMSTLPADVKETIEEHVKYLGSSDLNINVKAVHRFVTSRCPQYAASITNAQASEQKIRRYLHRNAKLVERRYTRVAQNTRYDEDVVRDYLSSVNNFVWDLGIIDPHLLLNMDETSLPFDQPKSSTLALRGARTIRCRTTGSSSSATVCLTVSMAGDKLGMLIIFRGVPGGRIEKELRLLDAQKGDGHRCIVQQKNWNDERGMRAYVDLIIRPWVGGRRMTSLLLLDDMSAHKCPPVIDALAQHGVEVDIVEPRYTGRVQVLDVGVNKPFKDRVRCLWENWLHSEMQRCPNVVPKVTRPLVREWAVVAWNEVTAVSITNTWSAVGFRVN